MRYNKQEGPWAHVGLILFRAYLSPFWTHFKSFGVHLGPFSFKVILARFGVGSRGRKPGNLYLHAHERSLRIIA